MPFFDQLDRDTHFLKHGHEFGATDALEYERMADAFMFDALEGDARECTRPGGIDRLRLGFNTRRLGVACTNPVFVRTFYVVTVISVASHGGAKGYFRWQCARIM
jgi:hypothetical protein